MTSLAHFENVAASIELPGEAVIDGASRPSLTGRSFDNVTPRNGTVINRVAECGAADVDAAVAAARRASEDGRWRKLHYRDKKRILPVAAYCNGEYGVKGLFVGVPAVLGAGGVEKVIPIDLNTAEQKLMDESASHVAELVEVVKKLAPDLA